MASLKCEPLLRGCSSLATHRPKHCWRLRRSAGSIARSIGSTNAPDAFFHMSSFTGAADLALGQPVPGHSLSCQAPFPSAGHPSPVHVSLGLASRCVYQSGRSFHFQRVIDRPLGAGSHRQVRWYFAELPTSLLAWVLMIGRQLTRTRPLERQMMPF